MDNATPKYNKLLANGRAPKLTAKEHGEGQKPFEALSPLADTPVEKWPRLHIRGER